MRDSAAGWVREMTGLLGSVTARIEAAQAVDDCPWFEPPHSAAYSCDQALDRAAFLELVSSRSYVATLAAPGRAALVERLGALVDRHAAGDVVVLPYVTRAFRSYRHR